MECFADCIIFEFGAEGDLFLIECGRCLCRM